MSDRERKTIKINPEIFNISGSKTKKVREKKQLPSIKPLISPNTLKNKLLKRIKEHKMNETSLEKKKEEPEITKYTDEFYDSIDYLTSLSKQKKELSDKELNEKKIKKKRELQRKTIKNSLSCNLGGGSSSSSTYNMPFVQLDLPDELKEIEPPVKLLSNTPTINLNYRIDNDVPYGCLKGGYKPTYKSFNKTQRSYEVNNPSEALIINNNNVLSEREKKLKQLKEKIQEKQSISQIKNEANTIIKNNTLLNSISKPISKSIDKELKNYNIQTPTQTPITIPITTQINTSINEPIIHPVSNVDSKIIINTNAFNDEIKELENPISNPNSFNVSQNKNQFGGSFKENEERNKYKKEIIKRTIKRKYKLGKSKSNNKVSVLIKDRNTRKNILNAQKELKKKPLSEVKNYLHKHGLIKIGSNAPNDIIRKMYEFSMLTGDINNNNADTLLHNFLKEKD